ncbi:MAG: monofunctional biosynthetic peptidoglycan transglycosylase [Pseudomonadota bacterium]
MARIKPKAEDRILRRQPKRRKRSGFWRRLRWIALLLVLVVAITPVALAGLYKHVAPPVTPLMVIRFFQGEGLKKNWTPLSRMSPHVVRAVIGLEDSRFCNHGGIDWDSVGDALSDHLKGGRLRGASTISMQTAKNLFLWPDQHFLRKALEAPLTYMIEGVLGKRRILEIYLNIVELGPGIYGVEAASQIYFKRPARALTPWQAGLLAAILPSPRKWSPIRPTDYIRDRARTSMARAELLRGSLQCTGVRG